MSRGLGGGGSVVCDHVIQQAVLFLFCLTTSMIIK